MRELLVTSKTMQPHVVPWVALFLHSRTLCSQHMQSSNGDEDQLAVRMVHAGSVVSPMTEAIALPMDPSALNAVV